MTDLAIAQTPSRRASVLGTIGSLIALPFRTWTGAIASVIFLTFCVIAVIGPWIAPYSPNANHFNAQGELLRLAAPSAAHWLGTTYYGSDVLSQLIVGTRIVVIVGLTCALFITLIGTNVGLISGYYGGRVDAVLMRITDLAFGIPFIPFAVVLVALLAPSTWNIILTISLLMWRTAARVIRSQVLSLKQRAFVKASQIAGASDLRIIYLHLFPNVLPMTMLYVAFDIAWAVIAEASVSFLGFGDPNQMSWGQMLYLAYLSGAIRHAWWWTIPPGVCLTLFVGSVFLIGREFEKLTNPKLA
ncbi:ABC transporter permease [Rhodoligotrophos defluvii]|uniref:ABC transporter permease n=1 Tax=Rhodoligotrophos defluvii TaxID=2561934 RepID=UPI0019622790|nr:ABC transporter permease [Rhodoligotrophos defluvii]